MKSGEALNLLKAAGKRNVLWEGQVQRQLGRGQEIKEVKTDKVQEGTDYKPRTNLDDVPMSARARYTTTGQSALSRQIRPSTLPESRNIGHTIWRRYPNGTLDVRDSVTKLRNALRALKTGVLMNENDALVVSSVFPSYKFKNLPAEIVNIKAYLSGDERQTLQAKNEELERAEALRAIVDLGGA